VRLSHDPIRTHASLDDPNLVSLAGLVPAMSLARRSGLLALTRRHVSVGGPCGANAEAKMVPGRGHGRGSLTRSTTWTCCATERWDRVRRAAGAVHARVVPAVVHLGGRAPARPGQPGAACRAGPPGRPAATTWRDATPSGRGGRWLWARRRNGRSYLVIVNVRCPVVVCGGMSSRLAVRHFVTSERPENETYRPSADPDASNHASKTFWSAPSISVVSSAAELGLVETNAATWRYRFFQAAQDQMTELVPAISGISPPSITETPHLSPACRR
jgi:hypothetical protein